MALRICLVLAGLGLVTALGCSGGSTPAVQCTSGDDCAGGEVCLESRCSKLCTSSTSCPAQEVCLNGVCVQQASATFSPPVIHYVDGDGARNLDTTPTPDGQPTDHRYHTALSIHGANLRNPIAVAIDAISLAEPLALNILSSSEQVIVASLPWDPGQELPGRYTLSVTNAQGTTGSEVWLLRGADGVTRLPSEIRDIVLSIPGIHSGAAWGRFYEAEEWPIGASVNTGDIFEDASGSGGFVRQATDQTPSGDLYGFQSDTIGEPIALSASMVTFRLKVSANVINADVAKLRCAVLTIGQSPVILDQILLKPDAFAAPDQWQNFTLTCPFAPIDDNQKVSIEEFISGLVTLSVDYVRVTPIEVCNCP